MKKYFFTFLVILGQLTLFAGGDSNSNFLKGIVLDRFGEPVIGAKVSLVESNEEVYTDFEGVFIFEKVASVNQQIRVNFISYHEKTLKIALQNNTIDYLKIQLQSK